jgi:hypothetical protein
MNSPLRFSILTWSNFPPPPTALALALFQFLFVMYVMVPTGVRQQQAA